MNEHFSDVYVKKAQQQGLRSRAVFKLEEIDRKDRIFKRGQRVVDLGAAPGGWSEYALAKVGPEGTVVAMDLLPIEPIPGVQFLQGDFSDDDIYGELQALLKEQKVDLVLSDIAPNMSGSRAVDQPKSMYLSELVLDFAQQALADEGVLIIKLFQGEGFDAFLQQARAQFKSVAIRKPKASRPRSREVYLLARGFKLV